MSDLKAKEYKQFEEIKHIRGDGSEYWSARELAIALDYTKWENFSKVIGRAMIACEKVGIALLAIFLRSGKSWRQGQLQNPRKIMNYLDTPVTLLFRIVTLGRKWLHLVRPISLYRHTGKR